MLSLQLGKHGLKMSKRGKNIGSFFIKQAKELPLQETNDVNCESEMSEEEEPQSKDPK